jgi:hypothetical protein
LELLETGLYLLETLLVFGNDDKSGFFTNGIEVGYDRWLGRMAPREESF